MGNTVGMGKSLEPAVQRDTGEMPMNRNDEQTAPKKTARVGASPGARNSESLHQNSTWANQEMTPVIIWLNWDQSGSQN